MTTPPGGAGGTARDLVVLAVLGVAVVLGAALSTPWAWYDVAGPSAPHDVGPTPPILTPEVVDGQEAPATAPPHDTDDDSVSLAKVLGAILGVVAVGLAAVVAWPTLRRLRRPARAPSRPATTLVVDASPVALTDLRDAVETARRELTPDVPPRDAIVAAWVALEEAAASAGTRRDPAQTPTEFTLAVLERTPADPDAVSTLRALYHRARFGLAPLTPDDVARARTALDRVAADLDVPATA